MSEIKIIFDMEGKEDEVWETPGPKTQVGIVEAVGTLPKGMASGATSVAICVVTVVDGSRVYAEMSLKMFQMAAAAFTSRWGDETGGLTIIQTDADPDLVEEQLTGDKKTRH